MVVRMKDMNSIICCCKELFMVSILLCCCIGNRGFGVGSIWAVCKVVVVLLGLVSPDFRTFAKVTFCEVIRGPNAVEKDTSGFISDGLSVFSVPAQL